jgi:hypothetical protein
MQTDSEQLTKVYVDLPNHWWMTGESLWARALGDDLYQLENVPFCAYGLNFGDVVLAVSEDESKKPQVRSVVRRSGHNTLRISFCDKLSEEEQKTIIAQLETMGGELERANSQFLSIDIPPVKDYDHIRSYLDAQEASGALEYETCEEKVPGSFDYKGD